MNVKLITYSETLNMSFKELSKYYNKQVLKIEKALKNRKQYCDSFIEIEKAFVMSLITFDDKIYFDDFDIIINSKDVEDNIDDKYELIETSLDKLEKSLEETVIFGNEINEINNIIDNFTEKIEHVK
jgi:hypothetical protein